jgi:hypothetical protein
MFFTFMRLSAFRRLKKRKLLRFDVHLADHCNLNCNGCDNFSPIAPKHFLEREAFERDCKRLSELTCGRLEDICLLGGEPLLHPEITGIIETARTYFPKTEIGILTNGLLLPKMDAGFWDCCREHDIKITITRYPVRIDIAAIKETARNKGVRLDVLYEEGGRSFYFKPLDRNRRSRPKNSFINCWYANRCVHLRNSRLSCAVVSYIDILNNVIMGGGGWNLKSWKTITSTSTRQKVLMKYLTFLPNRFRFAGIAIFQKSFSAGNGPCQKKNYPNGWSKVNDYI